MPVLRLTAVRFCCVAALLLFLAACSPAQDTALPTLAVLPTLAASDTAVPSPTVAMTDTPTPTLTPTASATASPSATATLTDTPAATALPPPQAILTLAPSPAPPPGVIVIPAGTQPTPRFVAQSLPEPVTYVDVLIAAQPVPIGIVLLPDQLMRYRLPAEAVPEGALREISEGLGLITRVNIACGEALLPGWLTEDVEALTEQSTDWPPQACAQVPLAPLSSPLNVVPVVVALRDIAAGASLSAEDIGQRLWPAAWVGSLQLLEASELIGRSSTGEILAGQLLFEPMLLPRP